MLLQLRAQNLEGNDVQSNVVEPLRIEALFFFFLKPVMTYNSPDLLVGTIYSCFFFFFFSWDFFAMKIYYLRVLSFK